MEKVMEAIAKAKKDLKRLKEIESRLLIELIENQKDSHFVCGVIIQTSDMILKLESLIAAIEKDL